MGGETTQQYAAGQLKAINQGLGSIKDAKILGRENFLVDLFKKDSQSFERNLYLARIINSLPRLFLEVLAICAILVVASAFAFSAESKR